MKMAIMNEKKALRKKTVSKIREQGVLVANCFELTEG